MEKIMKYILNVKYLGLIKSLSLKKETEKQIILGIEKEGKKSFAGKKIEDITKPLYRYGIYCSLEDVKGFIFLINFEYLANPTLEIHEEKLVFTYDEIDASASKITFPDNTRGCFNYSTRGFVNTLDENILTQVDYDLKGLHAQTAGIHNRTFAPYDGSQSGKYKHLNFVLNDMSCYLHLAQQTELSSEIQKAFTALFGKEYVEKWLNFIESDTPKIDKLDGYCKQITVPFDDDYVLLTPMFNHHVLQMTNELRYEKDKVVDLVQKQLGGTKPGNVSYTNLLASGSLNQFNMSFPKKTQSGRNQAYILFNKGVIPLYELKDRFVNLRDILANENIPNQNKTKAIQYAVRTLLTYITDKTGELLGFNSEVDGPYLEDLQNNYFGKTNKSSRLNFWLELFYRSMRANKSAKSIMTDEVVKEIENEVQKNV